MDTHLGLHHRDRGSGVALFPRKTRTLKARLKGRLVLSDAERAKPADIGFRLGRKALPNVATAAQPVSILAWYRRLVDRKLNGSTAGLTADRPRRRGTDCSYGQREPFLGLRSNGGRARQSRSPRARLANLAKVAARSAGGERQPDRPNQGNNQSDRPVRIGPRSEPTPAQEADEDRQGILQTEHSRTAPLQSQAARVPYLIKLRCCAALRGANPNNRAAVPPRMLCLARSDRNGKS